jgi:hypothetical protein
MSLRAANPGGRSVLTLDLVVAAQILMQLAVGDIGQVTDIQGLAGIASRWIHGGRKPVLSTRRICALLAR